MHPTNGFFWFLQYYILRNLKLDVKELYYKFSKGLFININIIDSSYATSLRQKHNLNLRSSMA